MTDKQIIIDGVDVKDCKRRIGKENYCRYYKRPCAENNYNCIWKKYLRKEQECEEFRKANDKKNELLAQLGCPTVATARRLTLSLKEQLEAYKMEAEEGKEINAELKAELEQYKDLAEHNGRVCNERLDKIDELEHDINELNGQLDQLKIENETYKKMLEDEDVQLALTEIRSGERHLWFNKAEKLRTENEELIAKYNDCHYVITNYHICFEGALGAIQELVKSEKTKEQVEYYTNVALNYLSMRYDERKKVPNKYKQTLAEIKEIAEDAKTKVFVDMEEFWKQILQKISKCEVENASK